MNVGDLARCIQGGTLVSPWIGSFGIILDVETRTIEGIRGTWYTIYVDDLVLVMHQDYLHIVKSEMYDV